MKNMNLFEDDPQLVKLIHILRPVPERDPVKAERNREKFLAELEELFPERKAEPVLWLKSLRHQVQTLSGQGFRPRAALVTVMVVLLVAFLFGGTSLTVSAAQNALPGDALYPIKTRLEQTRLRLISTDDQLATVQLELAQKRLDEIEALIRENRFDQVSSTAAQFEVHIRQALEALQRLAQTNPERAAQLSVQMTDTLERYLQALSRLLEKLPPEVKSAVEETISKSPGLSQKPTPIQREDANENERENATPPALSNENRNENDAGLENRDENEKAGDGKESKGLSEFTFVGFVEKIALREWLISGIRVRVASTTKIEAGIKTGDKVEVKVEWLDDQSIQAKEIRLREPGRRDDNENRNENENDENENGQVNNNESKITSNENSKSGKSDNTNQNLNDNDDDSDDQSNDNADNDRNENQNDND